MNATDHPIWPIVRLAVLGAIISPVLWLNASNFDETELRSILITLGGFGGVDYVLHEIRKRSVKRGDS